MKFKKIFFLIIILTFTFITTSCNKKEEPFFKEKGTEVTYDEIYNHFLERTIDILGPEEEFESYPDYVYVYNSYTKSNKKQGETIDNYEINEHNTSKNDSINKIFYEKINSDEHYEKGNNSENISISDKDTLSEYQYQLESSNNIRIDINNKNYSIDNEKFIYNNLSNNGFSDFFTNWLGNSRPIDGRKYYVNNNIYTIALDINDADYGRKITSTIQYIFNDNEASMKMQYTKEEIFSNDNIVNTLYYYYEAESNIIFKTTNLKPIDITGYTLIES